MKSLVAGLALVCAGCPDQFPTGRPNLHIGVVTTTINVGSDIDGACFPAADADRGSAAARRGARVLVGRRYSTSFR
jgi:hypothetical protein